MLLLQNCKKVWFSPKKKKRTITARKKKPKNRKAKNSPVNVESEESSPEVGDPNVVRVLDEEDDIPLLEVSDLVDETSTVSKKRKERLSGPLESQMSNERMRATKSKRNRQIDLNENIQKDVSSDSSVEFSEGDELSKSDTTEGSYSIPAEDLLGESEEDC